MMRLGRRATLLVALSLLTSVATAHAECAWVLWTESAPSGVALMPTILSSDSSMADCVKETDNYDKGAKLIQRFRGGSHQRGW